MADKALMAVAGGFLALMGALAPAPQSLEASESWNIADTGQPARDVTFTVAEGTWMSVAVSPDGETLVFDLLGDLYALPATGGDAVLLRGGPAFDRQPRFSPDGRALVFISDASGSDNIWISDTRGENARQVSSETLDRLSSPAWSRDGQYVAATRITTTVTEGFGSHIQLYHLAGGNGRVLVPAPEPRKAVNEPNFAPDGTALFFTEDVMTGGHPNHRDANQPNYAVKRLDLASGKTERISGGYGSATTPQVSPDGKRMAFVRRVKSRTVLFVRDLKSGVESPVYDALDRDGQVMLGMNNGYGYYPAFDWFPDNRHVALWGKGKLYRVDVDAATADDIPFRVQSHQHITDALHFTHNLAPDAFTVRSVSGLAVAPDGNTIVFGALGHLWQKALPGGVPRRLSSAAEFEFEPRYSPDGKSIVYASWDDEAGGAVKIISSHGGQGRTLYATPGVVRAPVFDITGRKLAFFIDQPNDLMGGYKARQGVYWVPLEGHAAAFVAEGSFPDFSTDSARLNFLKPEFYPWGLAQDLHSIRLDGLDDRILATSRAGAREFVLSPDGRWIAFRQTGVIYVAPYLQTGEPLQLDAMGSNPVISKPVSVAEGGWEIRWSADSSSLHWLLGEQYFSTSVNELFAGGRDNQTVPNPPAQGIPIGLIARTDVPAGALAFVNARIITMEDDMPLIENGTVVVEGNRITAVGSDVAIPELATRIDVSGKTIMPGLIDMHGHLTLYQVSLSPQKYAPYYAALAFGTTTNFDPSSVDMQTATNRDLLSAGLMAGPRYVGTGTIIPGYRGAGLSDPIDSLEDARRIMRRKAALGFSAVKSYMQPMRQQRQQVVKAAREAEFMVFPEGEGNFYSQLTMILDGHTTIEHNNPVAMLYDDVIQLFSASATAYTPTLIVTTGGIFGENYWFQRQRPWEDPKIQMYVQNTISSYSPFGGGQSQPPYARGMISLKVDDSIWDIDVLAVARAVKKASDAGVRVNAGSHGQINGIGLHWELWLLAEGGMTPLEVLRTATVNPAVTLGINHQLGSIKVGKLADLIVLDENPLEDIKNTNTVRYTLVNGRLYDSLTMNQIGNYDIPRTKFFWELPDYHGIDWNESSQGDDQSRFSGYPSE